MRLWHIEVAKDTVVKQILDSLTNDASWVTLLAYFFVEKFFSFEKLRFCFLKRSRKLLIIRIGFDFGFSFFIDSLGSLYNLSLFLDSLISRLHGLQLSAEVEHGLFRQLRVPNSITSQHNEIVVLDKHLLLFLLGLLKSILGLRHYGRVILILCLFQLLF